MQEEIRVWFEDILNALTEIKSFIFGIDFDEFKKDIKTKRAVERNIEIIGEAMSRILKTDSSLEISNSRKIVDTRNRIIHGYDTVSDEIVWVILTHYLPVLEKEIIERL